MLFSVALTFVLHVDSKLRRQQASSTASFVGIPLSATVAIEIEVSYDFAPLGAVLPVLEHFCHHVW